MAITHTTTEGTLIIPGAYASYKVKSEPAGLATTGVLMLVGEAEKGPHFSEETLEDNWFGPDQMGLVLAKYGSGPLVDAFANAIRPMNDPEIPGSPTRLYLAKTNKGTKGSVTLKTPANTNYVDLRSALAGSHLVTAVIKDMNEEVAPTTGPLTLKAGRSGSSDLIFRVNGGTPITVAIAAADLVAAVKTKVETAVTTVTATVVDTTIEIKVKDTATTPGGKTLEITDADEILVGLPEGIIESAQERRIRLVAEEGVNTSTVEAGGEIAFLVGYEGTVPATIEIANGKMVGKQGASTKFTADFAKFDNLKKVADYINSLNAGFVAKPFAASWAGKPSMALDEGTYACSTGIVGGLPARVKMDAAKLYAAVYESPIVELSAEAVAGLPAEGVFFLSGTLGATNQTDIRDALAAFKSVQGNFPVVLFSRDSTSLIDDGLTDTASDFKIDGIHTLLRAHALECSTLKNQKFRQGFASHKGTFKASKLAANDLAAARVACAFQDCVTLSADGFIKTFDPWMYAVMAAGGQAAAGHKAIFNKGLATNGAKHKDFKSGDTSMVEDALLNGLLTVVQREDGSYSFASDQTTYTIDDNFVYNSIQMMYSCDIIAATIQRKMHKAFTGASVADVSASVALSYLQSICSELVRLKLITPSDDAPRGWKNEQIQIDGAVMKVSLEVKPAGAIYFTPINITVSAVSQTAGA